MISAKHGNLNLVKYLIKEAKVDTNLTCNAGESSLYKSLYNGSVEIADYLIKEAKADVN